MATRGQPIFGEEDRVATTQLPEELKGVTDPLKIAAYYQKREGELRTQLRTPPTSRVTMTRDTDDERHEEPRSANFSLEEANAARGTLIATARQTARQGKEYWDRLSGDIEKLMGQQPPENQVSVQIWETCYHTLLGMNIQRLTREDKERDEAAVRVAAERTSTPSTESTAPLPLPVEVTSKILPGLNLSEEQYRTSQDHIASGKWPLTAENVSGKRVTVGGK